MTLASGAIARDAACAMPSQFFIGGVPLSGEAMLHDAESVPGRTRSLSWTAASVRERAVHQVVVADSPEARQPTRATVAG